MDLHIFLEGQRDLAGQLYRQLRAAVLLGRLQGGDGLPPTRELAQRLGVSRNTVTEAYDRLMSEGFVVGRIGAGTFVAEGIAALRAAPLPRGGANLQARPVWETLPTPFFRLTGKRMPYDFRVGILPDKTRFPFDTWRRLAARELRAYSKSEAAQGHAAGEPRLREAIARYVALSRAVICDPDGIVVANGSQQALDLIGRVLIEPGTVVAFEEPGYTFARSCFVSLGARVVSVPVDLEGIVVDRLPSEARMVYTTPSHQFPLGVPMSLARRIALLDWVRAHGAVIIEDDYDSEYRFAGRPLESLQNLDRSGSVLYVGTFSKVLFPALRLGFVVVPATLRKAVIMAKLLSDHYSSVLDQATLARFIADGHLAKHIRRMHKVYNARRTLLLECLEQELGAFIEPIPSTAGLHVAVRAKGPMETDALVAQCHEQEVGLYCLAHFCADEPRWPGLVLGYGAIEEGDIREGIRRLARAWAALTV